MGNKRIIAKAVVAFSVCCIMWGFVRSCKARQNATSDGSFEQIEQTLKELEARTSHYTCSDKIEVNMSVYASSRGVFGLKWGEKPRSREYKIPCDVDYPISYGAFNRMTLHYNDRDGGLFAVRLHSPQYNRVPDYGNMSRVTKKELESQFVQESCLPFFKDMIRIAEEILDQEITWAFINDGFSGLSKSEDDGYIGMLRMEVRGKNAEQVFTIMKE